MLKRCLIGQLGLSDQNSGTVAPVAIAGLLNQLELASREQQIAHCMCAVSL